MLSCSQKKKKIIDRGETPAGLEPGRCDSGCWWSSAALQALQFEREEGSFAGRYLGGFALMGLVARRRRAAPSLVMRMRAAFPDEEGSASGARRCSVADWQPPYALILETRLTLRNKFRDSCSVLLFFVMLSCYIYMWSSVYCI
jgi:hypothetical protein